MGQWLQHICVHCRTKFRHPAAGSRDGKPTSEIEAYLTMLRRFFNPAPKTEILGCPQCGLVPAESIGDKRLAAQHTCLRLGLLFLLPLLVVGLSKPFPVLLVVAGVLLVLWLSHLAVLMENPNKDLEANRKQAAERIQAGTLQVDSPGDQSPSTPPISRTWGSSSALALLLGLVAAVLAGSAEIALQINRWPRNPNWEPDLAGPGDRVWTYFPKQLQSINGLWTGTARAEILEAEELGLSQHEPLAFTRQTTWPNIIETDRDRPMRPSPIWAGVVLPNDPALAWQTIHIRFTVEAKFPVWVYVGYDDDNETFTHTESLRLGSPLAGQWYFVLAVAGMWLGTGLFVLQTMWLIKLASQLKGEPGA